jgi:tight adherence protein B
MPFLLGFTFVMLLLVVFAVLLLASRPSKQQKTVQARLGQLGLGDKVEEQAKQAEELLKQTDDDSFPWFDHLLSRLGLYDSLKTLIEQADSESTPGKVVIISLCLALVGFVTVRLLLSVLAIQAAAAVILAAAPVLLLRFQRSRRIKAFNDALPDAMDLMARALRAGHSVASAIEVIAERGRKPVSTEFALVYQQQNFGLPFRDALTNMAQRIPSKDLQFVVTAMLVQKETGGNLAEILDRTTHVLRERIRIFGEVRIKSAQGRLTGWILAVLPIALGFLINLVNHGFEKPLFEEQIGRVMLYSGAGMLAVGAFIISKIVKIEV